MTPPPIRRTGMAAFATGNAVAQVAALFRYTLLAWWLGPEQLGLAAMLVLTSQFFEQITEVGLDRFLVQSPAGNTAAAGRAVHLTIAIRGLAIGAGIALSSGLLARFFHHPELRQGLLLLALSPAVAGFTHLDYRRVQRHHRFGPEGVLTTASELVSLVALVSAAWLLRSYVAIAIALIARSAAQVAMSHVVARRPYRFGLPRHHGAAMLAFGLPLMMNGLLLFLGGQGDRLIIGNRLGATELGHYSAIILLVFYPATMLSRSLQSINMPVISAARNDPGARDRAIDRVSAQSVLLGVAMAAGFALVAPYAVPFIYGSRFRAPALLIAAIGMLQAARFVRLWPTTVSLATGRSRNLLVNSIVRLSAFPLAIGFAQAGHGLIGIVAGFILGEFVAFGASMLLLHRDRLGRAARDWARIALLAGVFATVMALVKGLRGDGTAWLAGGALVGAAALAWIVARERPALAALTRLARQRLAPLLGRR